MEGTLQAIPSLSGTLTPTMPTITGTLSGVAQVTGEVTMPPSRDVPAYEGEYIVTPELEAFVMPTNGYRMTDDVIVREIPISMTSNPYDGITVLIG